MDLNTPFSVLAWRPKDRMEHARYFKVFRVSEKFEKFYVFWLM